MKVRIVEQTNFSYEYNYPICDKSDWFDVTEEEYQLLYKKYTLEIDFGKDFYLEEATKHVEQIKGQMEKHKKAEEKRRVDKEKKDLERKRKQLEKLKKELEETSE